MKWSYRKVAIRRLKRDFNVSGEISYLYIHSTQKRFPVKLSTNNKIRGVQ